ncbi:hypothetical protein UVI_02005710 [Ustilaginoidea virens]|uniref:Uncharacterized protein n=1 Tax=Ustilaginoidea virens TaxID=1159556 RepID=A0A1B5KV21_USTVR|nr:hypothetical protein UVI_02005710 [Ustilaginoidea virens]
MNISSIATYRTTIKPSETRRPRSDTLLSLLAVCYNTKVFMTVCTLLFSKLFLTGCGACEYLGQVGKGFRNTVQLATMLSTNQPLIVGSRQSLRFSGISVSVDPDVPSCARADVTTLDTAHMPKYFWYDAM